MDIQDFCEMARNWKRNFFEGSFKLGKLLKFRQADYNWTAVRKHTYSLHLKGKKLFDSLTFSPEKKTREKLVQTQEPAKNRKGRKSAKKYR